jgi:hypothetical protein
VLLLKNYDKGRFDSIYSQYDFGELSCNEAIKVPDLPWKLLVPAASPPFPDLALASYGRDDAIDYGTNHWGKEDLLQDIAAELSAIGVDYDISDTHAPAERIAAYDLVICCTYDFMDSREAEKLVACAAAGSRVLVGPTVPSLDREMFPSGTLAREAGRSGSRIEVMKNAEDAVSAARAFRCRYRTKTPGVELIAQTDGRREILFAANVTDGDIAFSLERLGGARLCVLWGRDRGAAENSAEQLMPAYSVFAWEVQRP